MWRSYSSVTLGRASSEVEDAIRWLKTPSSKRAVQIAEQVCSEDERRELLLYHFERARQVPEDSPRSSAWLSREEIGSIISSISAVHKVALRSPYADEVRLAYINVWDWGRYGVNRIDPRKYPVEHAQVLMFLHDTACVLDRADLALTYARRAILILDDATVSGKEARDRHMRMRVNAALAEVVALSNLGLLGDARDLAESAVRLPGYEFEPELWKRTFLEQRLKAATGIARSGIYQAEGLAEQAREIAPSDPALVAGIDARLVNAYVRQGSRRSLRKARTQVEELHTLAMRTTEVSPLRRVSLLRTIADFFHVTGDRSSRDETLRYCMTVVDLAGLTHKRSELARRFGASLEPPRQ